MKKITLLVPLIIFISCSKNKEEKMFYDYKNSISLKNINVNLKDTDFKVINIEKIKEIIIKDSLCYFQKQIKNDKLYLFKDENVPDSLVFNDLLKYNEERMTKYIKHKAETLVYFNKKYNIEDDEILKGFTKRMNTIIDFKTRNISYKKQDSLKILSTKYKVTYSMTNPQLKIKQTFTKNYYTNSDNTKIIKEEELRNN